MNITRGAINFEIERNQRGRFVATARDAQGNVAAGELANSGGQHPIIYSRLEFRFYKTQRWIETFCDRRFWHLDDYETAEDSVKRPTDSGWINLTPEEMAELQRWADGSTLTTETNPVTTWQTMDIDSGLGIGGINNDQAAPFVPSVAAIERVQRMHDTDTVCRRCGASATFDGAMFTTIGGNICDDCA